jgi:hypothetical protein
MAMASFRRKMSASFSPIFLSSEKSRSPLRRGCHRCPSESVSAAKRGFMSRRRAKFSNIKTGLQTKKI